MRLFVSLLCCAFFWTPLCVYGQVFVTPTDPNALIHLEHTEPIQSYYGILNTYPHTYTLELASRTPISLEILEPSHDGSKKNVSAIIIRLPERSGRVTEIARLHAKDASWDTYYVVHDGMSYLQGPSHTDTLDPGIYHIQVHTPDNMANYVLRVGTKERAYGSYIETIRTMYAIRSFYRMSSVSLIVSPFILIPLVLLGVLVGGFVYKTRKKKDQVGSISG
jgi:hypothetical protein